MLTLWGNRRRRLCDGVSRRDFLRVGTLGCGVLTLADLFHLQAKGARQPERRHKAVIMVWLNGGPSHIDTYDLKPDVPEEYRGEFKPIQTNVPGFDICELLPRQATIADKLALVRNMKFFVNGHNPHELYTGHEPKAKRPAFGAVVSRVRHDAGIIDDMPPYVRFDSSAPDGTPAPGPSYLGAAHQAFTRPYTPGYTKDQDGLENLRLAPAMTLERLEDRKHLRRTLDTLERSLDDRRGSLAGMDAFSAKALEMIATSRVRNAFDLSLESDRLRTCYGKGGQPLLLARRLVEAGVSVVTLSFGQWDTHTNNFKDLRLLLPELDQGIHALVSDIHERGLNKDVLVVVWGEFGRTPRIGSERKDGGFATGRNHYPLAGFTLLAGGGVRTGQVVGATDRRAERPRDGFYGPQNVLATLYDFLGIDPALTLLDHSGRPMYLLDEREVIKELF
jgi:hypothetical protein